MNKEEEKVFDIYIPDNFQTGVNFLGENYATGNVIQAAILSIIVFVISFCFPSWIGLSIKWSIKLSIAIVLCSPCAIIGITGINGDSIVKFLSNIVKFNKSKRMMLYNPRVKTEYKVCTDSAQLSPEKMLPRDKAIALYGKVVEGINKRNRSKVREGDENIENIYFEDDYGVVETPDEYMSDKEIKAREKERRKHGKKRS